MSQMTCSNEVQRSSEEEESPACSLNTPCQDYAPDLTVTLMSLVRVTLSNYCKVHHVVWFPFTTMICHWSENDFPQPLPAPPLTHLKMRRWTSFGNTLTWTLSCPNSVTLNTPSPPWVWWSLHSGVNNTHLVMFLGWEQPWSSQHLASA